MKKILAIGLFASMTIMSNAQSLDKFFNDTDKFLKQYVVDGNVKYKAIKDNDGDLEALYGQISKVDLSGASAGEEKAFYINTYNILVIYQIVERYPIKGPLTVSTFFNGIKHNVAGKKLTLDGLEKQTLYKKYPDPRIHFAVVCAALGCPQLGNFAFKPATLESQLDERTKTALNREYFVRLEAGKNKVQVSKIFEWYKPHFTEEGSVLDFINEYRTQAIPNNYKLGFYEYDWNLNEAK